MYASTFSRSDALVVISIIFGCSSILGKNLLESAWDVPYVRLYSNG